MAVENTPLRLQLTLRQWACTTCCLLFCFTLTAQYRGGNGRGSASQDTEQTTVAGEPSAGMYGGGTGTGNSRSDSEEARPALPLDLLHFDAVSQEERVQVQWLTVHEIGMDRFSVERSTDGRQFTSIGELFAKGGAGRKQRYELYDRRPNSGINYYRLRSINLDGTGTLSEVRRIDFSATSGSLTLYPNPTRKSGFHLSLPRALASEELLTVSVTDITGRMVFSRTFLATNDPSYLIAPTSWSAGTYIVSVRPETGPGLSEKLIVFE